MNDRLIFVGIIGIVVTAILEWTPLLPLVLHAAGLDALTLFFDALMLPALFFFIILTAIAMWRHSHHKRSR